jgi:FtsZ-interacting cell division protein ZipA
VIEAVRDQWLIVVGAIALVAALIAWLWARR